MKCEICNSAAVFKDDSLKSWLIGLNNKTQEIENKIIQIQQEKNFLQNLLYSVTDKISNIEEAIISNWIQSLSQEDAERVKILISTKGNPLLIIEDNKLKMKWGGLTFEEISIKDIVE